MRLFQLTGEYLQALRRAERDERAPLPSADSRDWLIAATGAEIALFSLDQQLGAKLSVRIGALRTALEALNDNDLPRSDAIQEAGECGQFLVDDLADWLMGGRHRNAESRSAA